MIYYATLNSANLPLGFHYRRPVPVKRFQEKKTFGTTKFQYTATNLLIPADADIEWDVEGTQAEYEALRLLYYETGWTTYTFTGYWGDIFGVKFTRFEPTAVSARVYSMTGSFRIVSVTDWGEA